MFRTNDNERLKFRFRNYDLEFTDASLTKKIMLKQKKRRKRI